VTGADRVIHTQIVRGSESVSGELPGDLAAVAEAPDAPSRVGGTQPRAR
jgi:hypothetical protein